MGELRRYRRTALAAVLMVGAAASAFFASTSAGADVSGSWVPGTATATSEAFAVGPTQAGISYALSFGISVAQFSGGQGYGLSQTFDAGGAVKAAEVPECTPTPALTNPSATPNTPNQQGSPPSPSNPPGSAPADVLPHPAVAEAPTASGGNDSHSLSLNYSYTQQQPQSGSPLFGSENANATTQPEGTSDTRLAEFGIPGLFAIFGAQSHADTLQVPGQYRLATATADVAELLLGPSSTGGPAAVDIKKLHWQDSQQTGPGGAVMPGGTSGAFSIGSLTISGNNVPVASDSPAQLSQIINTALEGTGIHVSVPVQSLNSQNSEEDISPLSVGIENSQLLAAALGPEWAQVNSGAGVAPGPGQLATDLQGNYNPFTNQPIVKTGDPQSQTQLNQLLCDTNTPVSVASIGIAVLQGGGTLDLNIGGTTAVTDGTAYANPFAPPELGGGPSIAGGNGSGFSSLGGGGFGPVGGGGFSAGASVPVPGGGTTSPGGSPNGFALGRTAMRCVGSCGGDGALVVGLIGLAAIAGLGAADYLRSRRNRDLEPLVATDQQ